MTCSAYEIIVTENTPFIEAALQFSCVDNRARESKDHGLPTFQMFLRLRRHQWPQPEQPIGKEYPSTSSNGKIWEAVGPAREAFLEMSSEIKRLLEDHAEYLDEDEEVSPNFYFGLWMVGSDERHAIPTLILGCTSRNVRKRAENLIKDHGVLEKYPGVALSRHLDLLLDTLHLRKRWPNLFLSRPPSMLYRCHDDLIEFRLF